MQLFFHTLSFFLLSFSQAPASHLDQRIHNSSQPPDLHLSFRDFFASARLENDAMAWIAHFSLSWQNLLRCWNSRSWTHRMAPLPNKDWPQRCALCGRNLAPLPTVADQASASTKSMHSPAPLQTSFYVPLQPGLIETPATSYSKKGLQYAVDRNRQQATK